jgi:hypothetical protein
MKDDGGVRYWTCAIGCDCQVYRDGALIATVKSVADRTHYLDLDVVAGQKYAYVINAMGVNSNRREVTCERNNIKDVYPEVTDDSEVAAALEGSADAKLTGNITTAADYAAFRTWALALSDFTPKEVKNSAYSWLSYALNAETLIAAAPKEVDVTIDTFESAATDGAFDFTVKIDGIDVGEDALEANIRKVFDIEGVQDLTTGTFSAEVVEINAAAPEDGKVKFTVTPKGDDAGPVPDRFFFRVKMK